MHWAFGLLHLRLYSYWWTPKFQRSLLPESSDSTGQGQNSDRPTGRPSLLPASAIYHIRTLITAALKTKLEAEMLLFTNNTTRCHHPEDHHLNT
jgi:hypothetical protein